MMSCFKVYLVYSEADGFRVATGMFGGIYYTARQTVFGIKGNNCTCPHQLEAAMKTTCSMYQSLIPSLLLAIPSILYHFLLFFHLMPPSFFLAIQPVLLFPTKTDPASPSSTQLSSTCHTHRPPHPPSPPLPHTFNTLLLLLMLN